MHPYPHLRQSRYNKSFLSLVFRFKSRAAGGLPKEKVTFKGPAQNKGCPGAALGQQQHQNAMGNRCYERQAHGCVNWHPRQTQQPQRPPPLGLQMLCQGSLPQRRASSAQPKPGTLHPTFQKSLSPRFLAFALLQDTVLHLEISTLCQMLGRRVGNGCREQTFFLLLGRSIRAQSMA